MKRLFFLLLVLPFHLTGASAQNSRNGDFIVRIQTRAGGKSAAEHNTWIATVHDKAGAQLYRIEKEMPFDVQFPTVCIADDGSSIVISSFEGLVAFHSANGNPIKTLEPFGKPAAEYERNIKCSVAGNRAALLFSTSGMGSATILLADLRGNELWRSQLAGQMAGEVFLSADMKYVAAGSYTFGPTILRKTEVFDGSGMPVRSFEFLFRTADVASDGRVMLAEREKLMLASLTNTSAPIQWVASGQNRLITQTRMIDRFAVMVVETAHHPQGNLQYMDPLLIVLNAQGKEVARTTLNSHSNEPATLRVDRQKITLETPSGLSTLLLSELK